MRTSTNHNDQSGPAAISVERWIAVFALSYLLCSITAAWLIGSDADWKSLSALEMVAAGASGLALLGATVGILQCVFVKSFSRPQGDENVSSSPEGTPAPATSPLQANSGQDRRVREWRVWVTLLTLSLIWPIGHLVFLDMRDHDVDSKSCGEELVRTGIDGTDPDMSTGSGPVRLGNQGDLGLPVEGDEPITFEFGVYRDVRAGARTFVLSDAANATPDVSAFGATAFRRGDRVAAAPPELRVDVVDDRVIVSVCVNASTFGTHPTGTYTSNIFYRTTNGVVDVSTVKVSMQARYLWTLAPLVPVFAVLAIWLSRSALPRSLRQLWLTGLVVMTPGAAVYSAQALNDPGWSGKWQSLLALIASLYGAAMAAAATLNTKKN